MNPQDTAIATSLDLPSYLIGTIMLLLVMIFHGHEKSSPAIA